MHSGLGWKYWVDAYMTGLHARNRNPREDGNTSKFEAFYGKAPTLKRMIPFGSMAYIEKKTDKKSISRAIQGKMIGYPEDTQGWLFVCANNKLVATRHAWFDKRTYAERAYAKGEEPPRDLGFVETEGTPGIPLGGSDAKIRELVKAYEKDIIECSQPPDGMITRRQKQSVESLRKTSATLANAKVPENVSGQDTNGPFGRNPWSKNSSLCRKWVCSN